MKAPIKQFKLKREHIKSVLDTRPIVIDLLTQPRDTALTIIKTFANSGALGEDFKLKGEAYGTVDHPEFTKMRNNLEKQGYIQIEHGWWNGDRVTQPFSLNGIKFKVKDTFPCAAALEIRFSIKEKLTKSKKST
jgi:hypothetical protein